MKQSRQEITEDMDFDALVFGSKLTDDGEEDDDNADELQIPNVCISVTFFFPFSVLKKHRFLGKELFLFFFLKKRVLRFLSRHLVSVRMKKYI